MPRANFSRERSFKLVGEPTRGQPEIEGGIDEVFQFVGVEDPSGCRDWRFARYERRSWERGLVIVAHQAQDLSPQDVGARAAAGPTGGRHRVRPDARPRPRSNWMTTRSRT